MDTSEIAILIYFGLSLKMLLAVVAVYYLRLPSSKGTRKLKREGGQQAESAREEKTKSQPVLKSLSGRGIHNRAVSSGEKPFKPGPAANEVRKQVQPKNIAPVESSKPKVALKDDSVSQPTPPSAPRGQSAITEPKSGGKPPLESSKPKVALKDDSIKHTAFVGAPQPQAAFTVSKSGEKPHQEPSAGNTSGGERNELSGNVEPAKTIIKGSETSMDTEPGPENNQASSEPPAATADSGETDKDTSQKQNSGLGDLADLFATSASEFTEKNRLSEQVNEVDVNDILQEGLGLLGKVKKSDG